jgi:ABC-type glycerol-3-phosphate transport system permease component
MQDTFSYWALAIKSLANAYLFRNIMHTIRPFWVHCLRTFYEAVKVDGLSGHSLYYWIILPMVNRTVDDRKTI